MKYDADKDKAVCLYILNKTGGELDFHKLFKIIYFAEREHLSSYGVPLIDDDFIAMDFGPVPSNIYEFLKHSLNDNQPTTEGEKKFIDSFVTLYKYHGIRPVPHVQSNFAPDLEELSKTNIDCLDDCIIKYGNLNFSQRTELSHDDAWNSTTRNTLMDLIKIAIAGKADDATISLIKGRQEFIDVLNEI